MTFYCIVGLLVTVLSIYMYRPDGTTNKKYELYMTAVGFLIWPLIVVKIIMDKLK